MTKQETFKRRIRSRMEKTGERYNASRRALIERSTTGPRRWVSQPELSDDAVTDATGLTWDEWCERIESSGVDVADHGAIVSVVEPTTGSWWAQTVAVGYERITGLRLPHQMPDGTFSVSKSRTMTIDVALLRSILRSVDDRKDLFPGQTVELRSRPDAKTLRFGIDGGVVQIAMDPKAGDRTVITVRHEKLNEPSDVELWRSCSRPTLR
jgi:hypothetical protein